MVEGNFWATLAWVIELAGADTNPVELACDSVGVRLASDAADTNDRIEWEGANGTHAIVRSEASVRVRISAVRPLVD